ncbi:MAG: M3 family metallopeptidase [Deltaproteobacteria bacterium]|nr:M3 family metallopeptidase [Deltaproteobacteria bacterium]
MTPETPAASAAETPANPLLEPWPAPHGGVPPFGRERVEHVEPALDAAMSQTLAEVDRIVADPAPPDFANTLEALERAGRTYDRVMAVYGVWGSSLNTPDFQVVQREMAPKLAAFSDRILQSDALFRRIEAVYTSPEKGRLTPEQQRLAWFCYDRFVRAGAKLDPAAKTRVSEINQRLAALYTRFSQNVLAEEAERFLVLESEADLAGLPDSFRHAAAAAAAERRLEGWVIASKLSSVIPFLTHSERRDLREKAWRLFVQRGDNGGDHDNNGVIAEILLLRAERAKLLGYATHAHWKLENTMAKTPERALKLLEAVWGPAVAKVREDVAEMEALARAEGTTLTIEPWDYRYYAERVRRARHALDEDEVKQYLQLEKLREGMFWMAGELFGFRFTPVPDVPVYHPDVRVWEVSDEKSGRPVGLWYFDPYARPGKRSGAWMNALRRQERFDGEVTVLVTNTANFMKGGEGEPVLVSWEDATTLFHEFGHAIHGLCSSVSYPSLSGTAVPRDYVEFPSQLLEHWLPSPELLRRFALHHRTGEPMPAELAERLRSAATFNEGFATTEYLASAFVDLRLHLAGDLPVNPAGFEAWALGDLGMPKEVAMRHRPTHFLHVFGSDGYSAGYYSYLWSDVHTADAAEAFLEGRGLYDRAVARRLREHVLSVGNTIDPVEGYRAFRGRDARVDALMRDRGFEKG